MSEGKKHKIEDFLDYNPKTGIIKWKKNKARAKVNDICKPNHNNYVRIGFNGKDYLGHRIAWYLYYGKWPKLQIDHINGITYDNRICNLREVDNRTNQQNKKIHRKGKLIGCSYDKSSKKWKSQFKIKSKSFHIGNFNSEIEAHNAYLNKIKQLGK